MQDIKTIVPQEAKEDLVFINKQLGLTVEMTVELVKASRGLQDMFGGQGSNKSLKDTVTAMKQVSELNQKMANQGNNYSFLVQQIKELDKAEQSLVKTQARLANSESETNKETIEAREAIRRKNHEIKNEVIANNAAIGSLTQLRAQLNLNKQKYAELSETIRKSDVGKQMLLQIQTLDTVVKDLEAETGVFARNVGNYNNVQHGMAQVVRELPALGIDFRTFVMAISNNIPILKDNMDKMKAEGKTTREVWKAMAASLFSVNTLITAGITAMILFAGSAKGAELSIGKLNERVEYDVTLREKSINGYIDEVTHLKTLRKEIESETTTFERLDEIRGEIIKKYPKTLDNLKDEKYLIADLKTTIDQLNQGLIIHAQIRAAEELIAEKTKENLKGQTSAWQDWLASFTQVLAGEQAAMRVRMSFVKSNNDEYLKETERLFKFIDDQNKKLRDSGLSALFGEEPKPGSVNFLRKQVTELTNLRDGVKANSQEYHIYNNQLREAQKELDKLTASYKTEESAAKKLAEQRKKEAEELAERITDAQKKVLETNIDAQKAIYEDENETYENRLIALNKYVDLKNQLINRLYNTERQKAGITTAEIAALDAQRYADQIELVDEAAQTEKTITDKRFENQFKHAARHKEFTDQWLKEYKQSQTDGLEHDKRIAEERMRLIQKVAAIGLQAVDVWSNVNRNNFEEEMQRLQERDQENDRITQREVERIQRTSMSEQEKEEAIALAYAKSDEERRKIDQQRAEDERRKAAFDRTIALAKIAISTYIAVAKEVESKGVAGIATSGAVLAYLGGILSAASAIAVPAYAEGTKNHPGGPAILGDGGEPELVSMPGGKSFLSPDTDTLFDLPAGTSVTPVSKLMEDTNGLLTPTLLNRIMLQSGGNTARMERMMSQKLDEVKEVIERKPVQSVRIANGFFHETITSSNNVNVKLRRRL